MTDQATLAANTLNGATEEDRLHRLERLAEQQSCQIVALTARLEQTPQSAQPERRATPTAAARGRDRERELPYRFDAGPKWLQESGWREQSAAHRKAWPLLWRILELERWPGSPVRLTYDQLADHTGVSPDTVKRRLRWLKEQGVVEVTAGSGRRPSTVAVHHPIRTPIPYAEVPWPAGGMAGAPPGYLRDLAGPKRNYAELYGVELPESEPVPSGEEIPYREAPPPVEEPYGEQNGQGVQVARAGGAVCPPSEKESNVIPDFLSSPDAGARARNPEEEKEEETTNTSTKKPMISEIEQRLRMIPPGEVDHEAASTARELVDALGAHDDATATRAGQLAALALRQGEKNHLQEVCRRIRNRHKNVRIAVPTRYAISVLLQVRNEFALTEAEAEVGQRVLAREPEDIPLTGGDAQRSEGRDGERGGSFSEGYEWFFGESTLPPENEIRNDKRGTDFKEGYEWFFDKGRAAVGRIAGVEGVRPERAQPNREGLEQRRYEEVAELFERGDEDGENLRRLALRVRQGRLSEQALSERVAEVLDGDPGTEGRYRRAVASVLAKHQQQEEECETEENKTGRGFKEGYEWFFG